MHVMRNWCRPIGPADDLWGIGQFRAPRARGHLYLGAIVRDVRDFDQSGVVQSNSAIWSGETSKELVALPWSGWELQSR